MGESAEKEPDPLGDHETMRVFDQGLRLMWKLGVMEAEEIARQICREVCDAKSEYNVKVGEGKKKDGRAICLLILFVNKGQDVQGCFEEARHCNSSHWREVQGRGGASEKGREKGLHGAGFYRQRDEEGRKRRRNSGGRERQQRASQSAARNQNRRNGSGRSKSNGRRLKREFASIFFLMA
jgi:hypothetical protein